MSALCEQTRQIRPGHVIGCVRTAGHRGWHRTELGSLWRSPSPIALLIRQRAGERGSAGVVSVLAGCFLGGFLWLFLLTEVAQPAMCALHSNELRYCDGYEADR